MPAQLPALTPTRVRQLLRAFRRVRVLVVGDVMLDEFIWGKVSRISPEAPVPVVWAQRESVMPGGAANVANNVRALGGQVEMIGIAGSDRWGATLVGELASRKIGTGGILRTERPTTVKTRVIAHHQQVVRVDREENGPLSTAMIDRLVAAVRKQCASTDAIIIEDYGKGVITRELLQAVIPLARSHRTIITVDPKEEHCDLYRGVSAITPNRDEAGGMVGRKLETEADVLKAGEELLQTLRCDAVLITLGEEGMCLFEPRGHRTRIPTVAQEVFDVAGAGDTVIGIFTLALAGGASMTEAAVFANHAAGIVVGKLGVAVATPEELLTRLNRRAAVPNTAAAPRATRARRQPAPLKP